MDFEEIIYHLKQSLGKKSSKVIFIGCLLIVIVFLLLAVTAVIIAFKYHTQIYDGFLKIFNYIFNDSPNNVFRNIIKQLIDNSIKNLFSGN
jgi:hypothetical protein